MPEVRYSISARLLNGTQTKLAEDMALDEAREELRRLQAVLSLSGTRFVPGVGDTLVNVANITVISIV